MKVAVGSDHGGFKIKEKVLNFLEYKGFEVADMGAHSEKACDYPNYGYKVAASVASGEFDRGVLICKAGIGMSIIANKVPRIRAALCNAKKDALFSREHNDANILVLSANNLKQSVLKSILQTWFNTAFLGGRHARRVKQIAAFERKIINNAINRSEKKHG